MPSKHLAIVVPAVIVIVVAVAVYVVVPMFDSDNARMERYVGEAVQQARGQLDLYRPEATVYAANVARIKRLPDLDTVPDKTGKALVAASDEALGKAERLLKEAMGQQFGEVRGSDHPEANHLLAMVSYYRASVLHIQAADRRSRGQEARNRVVERVATIGATLGALQAATLSDPGNVIAELQQQAQGLRQQAKQAKSQATAMQEQIDAAQTKLAPLRQTAHQTNLRLAELRRNTPDPTDEAAVEQYREQYAALAKTARDAEYEADAIEHGWLAGARLDTAHGGDLLEDQYVGGRVMLGLTTLLQQHAVLDERAKGYADGADAIEVRARGLQKDQAALGEIVRTAKAQVDAEITSLREALGEVDTATAEAESIEGKALDQITQSLRYFNAAIKAASSRARRISETVGTGDGTSELATKARKDKMTEALAHAGMAESLLLQAQVSLQRVTDAIDQQAVLTAASDMLTAAQAGGTEELAQTISALAVKIDENRNAGMDSVDNLDNENDAVGHLTQAEKAMTGSAFKDGWILKGQTGQAWFLLAQLAGDQQTRDEAMTKAAELLGPASQAPDGTTRADEPGPAFARMLNATRSQGAPAAPANSEESAPEPATEPATEPADANDSPQSNS